MPQPEDRRVEAAAELYQSADRESGREVIMSEDLGDRAAGGRMM